MSISILSLAHAHLSVPVGQLTPEFIVGANKKIQAILKRAEIKTLVGGMDFSVNEDDNGDFDPYYQIQWWVLAPTQEDPEAEIKLRAALPRTDTTPRPVTIQPWDG